MNIKELIKALLQSKFGGVQLSAERVEAIAKRLEGKVKDEAELESKLVTLDEALPFADIAKEDDRLRSLEAEAKKKTDTKLEETKVEEVKKDEENKDTAVLDALKALTETVQALKVEKVVGDRKSTILSKLKDADESYSSKVLRDFGRMNFATDEDFEAYLDDVEKDFTTHVQSTAESKLGNDRPFIGIGAEKLKDDEVSPAMKAIIEQRKAEAEAKAKA